MRLIDLNYTHTLLTFSFQDSNDLVLEKAPVDPNSFKNLNIFPQRDDLLSESKLNIQPNIINGAYPSVEHYLDVQFKLLREDCFGPLREGISW